MQLGVLNKEIPAKTRGAYKFGTDFNRFMHYIKIRSNGCWEWQGGHNGNGYGKFKLEGKTQLSHRVAYSHYFGVIPKNKVIKHSCHNPSCCNPDHLKLGTQKENMIEKSQAGRHHGTHLALIVKTLTSRLRFRSIKDFALAFGVNKCTAQSHIQRTKNKRKAWPKYGIISIHICKK